MRVMPLAFATSRLYALAMNFNNKNLIILICLILGAFVFFKVSQKNYATKPLQPSIEERRSHNVNTNEDPGPQGTVAETTATTPIQGTSLPVQEPPPVTPTPSASDLSSQVSEQAKMSFQKESFLEVSFPDNIKFRALDIDVENAVAITSRGDGIDMTMLARKGAISGNDVEAFIKSADTGIPGLDSKRITYSAPKTMPTVSGSGIRSAQLWKGTGPQGEVHVAILERADGAGTYMFVVSGKGNVIEKYDDDFERIFKSLKAKPLSP